MPRFTIITVCYNSGQTIERTIKSVVSQTFKDFEYIIVDGVSKDNTLQIVEEYHKHYPTIIKYISEPDKGIYDAMNKGILMATGDLIGIVNSDDWLEPDAIENVNSLFEQNNSSLESVYVGGLNFHHNNGKVQSILPNLKKFYSHVGTFDMVGVNHPASFIPKHVYNSVGLYDTKIKISADVDFILRCYYSGKEFQSIPVVVSNMSDGGLSNDTSWKNIRRGLKDKRIRMSKYDVSPLMKFYLEINYLLIYGIKYLTKKLHLYRIIMKVKS